MSSAPHGHALIDWIADYLEGVEHRPVSRRFVEPGCSACGNSRSTLRSTPRPWDAVMADVDDDRSCRASCTGSTRSFFAYFPANASFPSILGELLSAGLGVQGMSWVTSPACTEVETLMLDWMRELLALPERFDSRSDNGGGVIQGTASEATLVAILSARWRATGGAVNADGDTTPLVAYTTSQAHSSIEKGLRIAGIGTDRTRIVVPRRCVRHASRRTRRDDRRRPRRRPRAVLRVLDTRHDVVDGVRPDPGDRRDLQSPRGDLAARRCRDVGDRRARPEHSGGSTTGWSTPTRTARTRTSGWASTSTATSTGPPTATRSSAR
jgi:hypothetical protein